MTEHTFNPYRICECDTCRGERRAEAGYVLVVLAFLASMIWLGFSVRMNGPTEDALCAQRGGIPTYIAGNLVCFSPGVAR